MIPRGGLAINRFSSDNSSNFELSKSNTFSKSVPFPTVRRSILNLPSHTFRIHFLTLPSMPTYKGYKASILDGLTSLPLPEYETTVSSNPDFVTCYIESSADQFFNIVLEDMTAGISQGTAVYVDGIYIDNGLTAPGVAVERRWYGKRIDHESVRPFI